MGLVPMQNIIQATCTVKGNINPAELQAVFTSEIEQAATGIRDKHEKLKRNVLGCPQVTAHILKLP